MEKLYTPYIVAFSGGCFSGKTTTINKVAEKLRQLGYTVYILNENIRDKNVFRKAGNIDNIRQDPNSYLLLQNEIIREKIENENEILDAKYTTKTIILVDRALTDSLFYLSCYVDKANLTLENKKIFRHLFSFIYMILLLSKRYDKVLEFRPIKIENIDKYRPKDLEQLHFFEYEMIHCLNNNFFDKSIVEKNINAKQESCIDNLVNNITSGYAIKQRTN